jgi:hypothetical protein
MLSEFENLHVGKWLAPSVVNRISSSAHVSSTIGPGRRRLGLSRH